jgi:uncharacterized repeat protein (TIGR03803 family)
MEEAKRTKLNRAKPFRVGIANAVLILSLTVASTTQATAQTFNVLYSFGAHTGDSYSPAGLLAQGRDGNLYGTTVYGGTYNLGTVFKVTPTGKLTVLHNFDGTHGSLPWGGGVILGTDGNFYGATAFGGTFNDGTVFKITPAGKLTVLYNFTNGVDGETPWAPPIQGDDGNLYGTTCGCPFGGAFAGTVYKLTRCGTLTTLHEFAPNAVNDGVNPQSPLMQATDGTFYGTATNQGAYDRGTIFKITAGGSFTALHSFDEAHGARDYGQLVQGSDFNFYGPTAVGGTSGNGALFKMTLGGRYTVIRSFNESDGAEPGVGLVLATDGNFYSVAYYGGTTNDGTIYRISPDRSFSVLYNFDGATGSGPAALLQHTNGALYGHTFAGGPYGGGTVFSWSTGLGAFVRLVRHSGKVGATVGILGQNFIGASSVAFNGIPATFTVRRDTYLEANVPAGATTGYVQVTTPSGNLTSSAKFRVMK